MTKYLVAAAQLGPASATRAQTVARIVRLIGQAKREGVEFVVFPELALSPYFAAAIHDDVTPYFEPELPSAETMPIIDAVAAAGIPVVLPFAERQGASLYNSAALLNAEGGEIGRFRKMHLPGRVEPLPDAPLNILEKRYFTPGDLGFPVYQSPLGPMGMLICYDRRFPEAYRCLTLAGAEIIAIGYNTPYVPGGFTQSLAEAQEQSELCMRAGAYASGVPVIAAGKGGVENGVQYIGGSVVIGPTGTILAKATTDGDEIVAAEIDLQAAADVRARMNLELNRRPETYSILTRTPVTA